MHSTSKRPSNSERRSGLPRLWQPLWPLQRLQVPVLLLVGEQRGRPEQREAPLVASRFVRGVHGGTGAGTHARPNQRRESSVPACPSGRLSLPGVTSMIPTREFASPLSISRSNGVPSATSFSLNQTETPRDSSRS